MEGSEIRFGDWLRRKLVERHLSLAQLCRAAGCDYTYLWRIIHAEARPGGGRRYTRPSYALTERIGRALDAPREALAAAGYGAFNDLDSARAADRLAALEQDLAKLRADLIFRAAEPGEGLRVRRLPLLGHIQAGDLHEALAHPEESIALPEGVLPEADFALRVRGESMSPTLLEGDIVAVRKQETALPGEIVVAAIGEEVTLKRFELRDGIPMLAGDNPAWPGVPCGPRVRILGVVTGSYRPPEVLLRRPREGSR